MVCLPIAEHRYLQYDCAYVCLHFLCIFDSSVSHNILTMLHPSHTFIMKSALAAAADYGVPRFTGDAMDVITDPEVDAVWICSPSQYHAEQIKACAANGKHVFCEKPIATDLAETVEAINCCNEAGVKLMIGLQRRFDPNFKRVKNALGAHEVGDTIMVSSYHTPCTILLSYCYVLEISISYTVCDHVSLYHSSSRTDQAMLS